MTHKYTVWKDAHLALSVEAGGTYRYNCPERFNSYYLSLTTPTCNWFNSELSLLLFICIHSRITGTWWDLYWFSTASSPTAATIQCARDLWDIHGSSQ